jgi:serine/threonine-protein kinase
MLVADKYRVEHVIGEGGMGVVVAATHEGLEQRVAIKFLAADAMRSTEVVERFMREAKVAAKVKSDHVARVSDVGRVDGGTPFIVMEYLEGTDLAGMIDKGGPLPVEEACEIGLQACEALAEVHAAGIVHRDLKPSNLFVTRRADGSPSLKLLDFGISKLSGGEDEGVDPALTATATIMGSPSYMSPEQLKSTKEVDARTDVWSLGAVMYEALTGKRAFKGETVPQVCAMIASEEPVAPVSVRAEIPADLEQAVLKCLVKKPEERSSLVALARSLVVFAPERERASLERVEAVLGAERSRPLLPSVAEKAPEIARTQQSWHTEDKRRRGGPSALTLLLVLVAGGVGVGIWSGKIDVKALGGQVSSATSAVASAIPVPSSVPPLASVVAPIASAVAPLASAVAPIASAISSAAIAIAPPSASASAAPAGSSDEADAQSDEEPEDEEPAASSTHVASPVPRPPSAPHTTVPRRAPVRPKHGKGWRKHH